MARRPSSSWKCKVCSMENDRLNDNLEQCCKSCKYTASSGIGSTRGRTSRDRSGGRRPDITSIPRNIHENDHVINVHDRNRDTLKTNIFQKPTVVDNNHFSMKPSSNISKSSSLPISTNTQNNQNSHSNNPQIQLRNILLTSNSDSSKTKTDNFGGGRSSMTINGSYDSNGSINPTYDIRNSLDSHGSGDSFFRDGINKIISSFDSSNSYNKNDIGTSVLFIPNSQSSSECSSEISGNERFHDVSASNLSDNNHHHHIPFERKSESNIGNNSSIQSRLWGAISKAKSSGASSGTSQAQTPLQAPLHVPPPQQQQQQQQPLGPWYPLNNSNDGKQIELNPRNSHSLYHTIPGQNSFIIQVHVSSSPSSSSVIFVNDKWTSSADGLKSHDLQYWQPLVFNDSTTPPTILPLEYQDWFELDIGIQ